MQEKLAQSAMVQHSRALDEHSRKSNAMQDIIDEQQRLLNESHLDFTELTDQKRQLAEQIASLNSSLEDQVHLLDENRCSMVDEQQARKHAETNLANSNQTIALLNVKTEALENSLQREAAGRRKAEAALRRASVTAEIDSIARTSQMQIDAEKKVLRLSQELSSTKLLALSHHRMAQANIKQGQVEIERLMRLLDSMHRNPQNESAIRNAG